MGRVIGQNQKRAQKPIWKEALNSASPGGAERGSALTGRFYRKPWSLLDTSMYERCRPPLPNSPKFFMSSLLDIPGNDSGTRKKANYTDVYPSSAPCCTLEWPTEHSLLHGWLAQFTLRQRAPNSTRSVHYVPWKALHSQPLTSTSRPSNTLSHPKGYLLFMICKRQLQPSSWENSPGSSWPTRDSV